MKIGLIDVDSHNFPNLALMRISAYHKARGDDVEWWFSDLEHYDIVYKSKVFSETYTVESEDPINADLVIKGGTGYSINTINGMEVFDKESPKLPTQIEEMPPDYSIYPKYDFAVSMTTRGCPNNCAFCHVCAKEGRVSQRVADVGLFYNGQPIIKVLDANITACRDKRSIFREYINTGAVIDFTQGLDIRLVDDDDIYDLGRMRIKRPHFAWDDPDVDLTLYFERFKARYRRKDPGTVYVLTNFGNGSTEDHVEKALYRIEVLSSIGFSPFVMVYDRPNADPEILRLQRWCNNNKIFRSCDYRDYQKIDADLEDKEQMSIFGRENED